MREGRRAVGLEGRRAEVVRVGAVVVERAVVRVEPVVEEG